jgi:hypothetical protein
VRPVSDPPELLDEPPPEDEEPPPPDDGEPPPDDELSLLDCVAPEGVTLERPLDDPLELPLLLPLSPLVAASRVRTRV